MRVFSVVFFTHVDILNYGRAIKVLMNCLISSEPDNVNYSSQNFLFAVFCFFRALWMHTVFALLATSLS